MSSHRIRDLADPIEDDDAVTKRYVGSRAQALNDNIQDIRSDTQSALDRLNRLIGDTDNQI